MHYLHIDLKTFSVLDIKQVGLYKYAENCRILLCAYDFDDESVAIIDLASGEKIPADFLDALCNPNIFKTAYKASFEFQVLGLYLGFPAGLDEIDKGLHIFSDKQKKIERFQRLL